MGKGTTKVACPFCGTISEIDTSIPKEKMSVWERDCLMSGICEKCYEKTFNVPTREHKEEWGEVVRYCPNCDCHLYQKDIDKGRCYGCWMPVDEMDEADKMREEEESYDND